MANTFNHNDKVVITDGGSVGIGTTSPGYTLQVGSTSANSSATIIGNSTAGIEIRTNSAGGRIAALEQYFGNEGSLWLYLSNTAKVLVRANGNSYFNGGNVGIGTTSPGAKLDVAGDSVDSYIQVRSQDASIATANESARVRFSTSNETFVGHVGYVYRSATQYGVHLSSKDDIHFEVNNTTSSSMVLNASGNVGIGTTAPDAKLVIVTGSADDSGNSFSFTGYGSKQYVSISKLGFIRSRASDLNGANMHFLDNGGTNRMEMAVTASSMTWYSHALASTFMVFQHTTGNVGIGTTSPAEKLHVNEGNIRLEASNDGSNGILRLYDSSNTESGQIYPHSGDLRIYSANDVLFNNSGNVGIGTISPDYRLTVEDAIRVKTGIKLTENTSTLYATDGALSYYSTTNGVYLNGAGTNGWLRLNAAGTENYQNCIDIYGGAAGAYVVFRTNNSERMLITSGGNVGIGTTSPGAKLEVNGTGVATAATLKINTSSSSTFVHSQENMAANLTSGQHNILVIGQRTNTKNSGYIGYYWAGDASNSNFVTIGHWGVDDIFRVYGNSTITMSGSVGIGTTSPSEKLDIDGRLRLSYNNYGWIYGYDVNHSIIMRGNRSGTANNYTNYHQYGGTLANGFGHLFWTGGTLDSQTLRMQIADDGTYFSGNVGIGTNSPSQKLSVYGNIYLRGSDYITWSNGDAQIDSTSYHLRFHTYDGVSALVERMRITSGGNVGFGTTSPSYKIDVSGGAIAIRGNAAGNSLRFDDSLGTSRNAMYVDTSNYLNIGNANYAGVKFVQTASAPSSGAFDGQSVQQAIGTTDEGIVLAAPDAWLAVRVGTTDYAIPMYTTG